MPFTFSHPAIVLPLTLFPRKWFSLTALVVGSMAPDFEYFLRMKTQSEHSHTTVGIFWFNLPLGIVLAYLFHHIVRNALFDNLPVLLKSRLASFKLFNWHQHVQTNLIIIIISFIIGAASHIFWDAFTHHHGYFVQVFPALGNTIEIWGKHIPFFKILQHTSTLVGGLFIIYAILRLPIDKKVKGQLNLKYWGIIAAITLTIIILRLVCGLDYKLYGHVIATTIAAGLIALIVTPLLYKNHT